MASDAALRAMDMANPCCVLWKTKFSKMEEKRNALRQGVEILKGQIDRLQQENLNLKKAYDEQRERANVSEEEKGKEACLRISMENEIAALKSEISSAKQEAVSGNEDLNKEVTLLRACLSERQVEIDHLKRLLTEEGGKVDAERERADLEKNKAAELQVALEHEKIRADQARKMADAMEKEIAVLRSKTSSSGAEVISGMEDLSKEVTHLRACISEREQEVERLQQLLTEQERKADTERQCADLERRKTVELQEALAHEKSRADVASKLADALGKEVKENSVQLEILKNEVDKTRLKYEEAKKKLEAEKQKVTKEKKRVEEERARVIEQRSIAEEAEKQVVEEKSRASNLLMQLEDKQRNIEKLQKEFQGIMLSQKSAYSSELDEVKRNLEAEKKKYATEKKRADDEMSKSDEQKKVAEASTKKSIEEKHRADKLSQELQSSRQRVDYLEQQLREVNDMLEVERKKASREVKCADAEASTKKSIEEKHRADKVSQELQSSRQRVDYLEQQLREVNDMLEVARKRASREEKRADAEKLKSYEQEKIAGENRRMATEEKLQADNLQQELESNRKKLRDMENELQSSRQRVDYLEQQLREVNDMLEVERKKASREVKCADAEVSTKKSIEEKHRADKVSQELQSSRQRVDYLEQQLREVNDMLEVERKRATREEKRADAEKLKSYEQEKIAGENRRMATEEKLRADNLQQELESNRKKLWDMENELQSSRQRVDYLEQQLREVNDMLEVERKKASREVKCADAEASTKKGIEEKHRAEKVSQELQSSRQRVDYLEQQLRVVNDMLEVERKKASREEKRADAEASTKKSIEEKHHTDKLSQELQSSRQRVEYLEQQLREVNDMLEVERKRASREEKRADAEKLKSYEQEKIAGENRRMATEEKLRADNLQQELESNRKKLRDMENELQERKLYGKLAEASYVPPVVSEQTSAVQFLRKQLKFEKQRVKHAKEVAELEKERKNIVQEEIFRLRNGLECLLNQFDLVTDIGARNGANNVSKITNEFFNEPDSLTVHICCRNQAYQMCVLECCPEGCCHHMYISVMMVSSECPPCHRGMHLVFSRKRRDLCQQFIARNHPQERVTCSLTTSAVLAQEMTNLQTSTAICSNECNKCKNGEKVGIAAENSVRSPAKPTAGHAIKRRKILDELESIKSMQSEGKRIFEETEKKLSALHSKLFQPMGEEMDKETSHLPVRMVSPFSNYDPPSKKRKASHEPETTCRRIDDSSVEAEMDKHAIALTASKRPESSPVLQDASRDLQQCNEDVTSFEVLADGDYMKLLSLDNADDEECYRTAMERPLSPTLPEIDLRNVETRIDAQMLSMQVSNSREAEDQHSGLIQYQGQLYCIVFPDMEEHSSINRIFSAVRVCVAQCCLFLRTNWLVHDILAALRLEKDLRPREKVCALFSLILLNFFGLSPGNPEDLQNKDLVNSFSAHIRSVLCCVETSSLFAEICHINDLLAICQDFVLCRRILLHHDTTSGSLHDSSSSFEILHDGEKIVLSSHVATVDMIMAGSIVLASICAATGQLGYLREVSFNVLCMCMTEEEMVLRILHMFVHVSGQEYLSRSNYGFMEVVKSVITYVEHTFPNIAAMDDQSKNETKPCFMRCVRCPFSQGALSLDDVSALLVRELQSYCLGPNAPQEAAGHVDLSTRKTLCWNLGDILSSLELIASKMGWNWACNNIMPKLLKMLESCDQGRVSSTALVTLLGELGRIGIRECGYDDVGVESIKCQLSDILCHVDGPKCNAFAVSVVSALVGLHPNGHEEFVNNNIELPGHSVSAIPGILRDCLSRLKSEQASSLLGL